MHQRQEYSSSYRKRIEKIRSSSNELRNNYHNVVGMTILQWCCIVVFFVVFIFLVVNNNSINLRVYTLKNNNNINIKNKSSSLSSSLSSPTLTYHRKKNHSTTIIEEVQEEKYNNDKRTDDDETYKIICRNGLESFMKYNIQLAAFDFDQTIVNVHTWGKWKYSSNTLVKHVRKEFQCLLNGLIQNNIYIAITTFSTQKELIHTVLNQSLLLLLLQQPTNNHNNHNNNNMTSIIPIFGGNDYIVGYNDGKQSQLKLAIDYFQLLIDNNIDNKNNNNKVLLLKPETTVLIDDDINNILIARKDGYRTVHYKPKNNTAYNALVIDE